MDGPESTRAGTRRRPQPVGQRRGSKAHFFVSRHSRVRGAAREAILKRLEADDAAQAAAAYTAEVQIRLHNGIRSVQAHNLVNLPVTAFLEVRRPAAHARRSSPSGQFPVVPESEEDEQYAVWHDSRVEQNHMTQVAWDEDFGAFVSQPLRLDWVVDDARLWHIPDLLIQRRRHGTPLLIDSRPRSLQGRDWLPLKASMTAKTVAEAGWDYEVWDALPAQRARNLQHIHLFNQVRDDVAAAAVATAECAGKLFTSVGGFLHHADALTDDSPGALYHALWRHLVHVDLGAPIRMHTRFSLVCMQGQDWRSRTAAADA